MALASASRRSATDSSIVLTSQMNTSVFYPTSVHLLNIDVSQDDVSVNVMFATVVVIVTMAPMNKTALALPRHLASGKSKLLLGRFHLVYTYHSAMREVTTNQCNRMEALDTDGA